ncbi:MAG: hypothetical protein M5U27_04650 [Gaiella sp.]|nr:hypothetical protein [Gaiella sp.]
MSDADRRFALVVVARVAEPVVGEWRRRYGDAERVVVPHCPLGVDEEPDRLAATVRERLGPRLPIRCHAVEVSLVGELPDGSWLTRETSPFEGHA